MSGYTDMKSTHNKPAAGNIIVFLPMIPEYPQFMKYIAFILSLYIFCLVSAPCVDDALHCGNQVCGQSSSQNQDSHSDHTDACSPFCVCSCCGVPVTIAPGTFIGQPFVSFQRPIHPESSTLVSFFAMTFWQPPKIG